MNDITTLLQTAVSNYRSPDSNGSNGSLGLSKILGISNGSLSRKVSPNDPVSHCSPAEVVAIVKHTGDLAPMHAMAAQVGCMLMPIELMGATDMAPDLATNFKELGEWLQAASAANAAEHISDNAMAGVTKELVEGIAACIATHQMIKAKHAAGKQVGLKAVA